MAEKKKDEEVLLVRDEKTGEISVVAGLNKDGTPKRTPANQKHAQDFLRFDRNGDALTTFLTNFYRQCKEPNRFGFYRVAVDGMEKVMEVVKNFLKEPETYKDLLAPHKVDTSAIEQQVAQERAAQEQAATQAETQQADGVEGETPENEAQQAENAEGEAQEQAQEENEGQVQGEEETPAEGVTAEGVTAEEASVEEVSVEGGEPSEGQQREAAEETQREATEEQLPDGMQADTERQGQTADAPAPQPDENGFDWTALEQQWGISLQELTENKELDNLDKHGLSNLVTIHPEIGGQRYEIQARLEVRTMPDGSKNFEPHFIQKEPKLDMPYKDIEFTDADRKSLQENGNLGRVVEIVDKETGEIIPSYISIDRQTNELTDIPASEIKIPQKIGKTELAQEEQALLASGLPLKKEIELNNNRKFTTTLQVNVQYRGVEFVPKNKPLGQKKSQWQGKKEKQTNGKAEARSTGGQGTSANGEGNTTQPNHQENRPPDGNRPAQAGQEQKPQQSTWLTKEGTIRPIGKWKGQPFDEQQKKDYVAGKTVVLQNATDREGKPCTLYITFDWEKGKPVSSEKDPTLKQVAEGIPSNESRTQMAVNNDGATNEATKHVSQPLQQGQVAPANTKQQQEQQQGERQQQGVPQADEPRKGKGMRM